MDIFVAVFIVFVLYGCKYNRKAFFDDYLSKENTLNLKGVLAIVVLLHHLAQSSAKGHFFRYFTQYGYLAVAVFFFLSGYGLMFQYKKRREEYLKNFLYKRVVSIFIPYLFISFLYFAVYNLLGHKITIAEYIKSFYNGSPVAMFSWYVISILIFYIIFYISCCIFKDNYKLTIISVFILTVVFIILCKKLNYGFWWYNSSLAFVLGILYYCYIKKINKIYIKNYKIIVPFLFSAFIILFMLRNIITKNSADIKFYWFIILSVYEFSALLFTECILCINSKLHFKNILTVFLGRISYELYLIQGLFIIIFRNDYLNIENDMIFCMCVIFCSIPAAYIVKYINKNIMKVFYLICDNFINGVEKQISVNN